ncbi:AB1gp63 [Acinetobacter phage AB1]|uniref:AB1gp63 n=1 Tax=Acinetobacter phage AB1 TaxID=889876 RepID=E2GM01_9CAUD|nr:AB1gp63 [Acinetobacter phage AB1]ADO14434.1 AB1gp63 [Acinetobacter phage AB1]
MNILELAKIIDNSLSQDEFLITTQKVGGVSSILISPRTGHEIEFCKVGGVYGIKRNGEEFELRSGEFESLLSPYLGKRMLLNLMN